MNPLALTPYNPQLRGDQTVAIPPAAIANNSRQTFATPPGIRYGVTVTPSMKPWVIGLGLVLAYKFMK